MTDGPDQENGSIAAAARYLADNPDATAVDLDELGIMRNSLLAPEAILTERVDPDRLDLVEEFRSCPCGPYGEELRQLLWNMRAQTPVGRYVLARTAPSGWRVLHLIGGRRRPRGELVPGPTLTTIEDAEWEIFRLRWRDHTGHDLPGVRVRQ